MSIFAGIKTEKDLENLKRKIMREDIFYKDILRLRAKLNNPAENLNTTPEHVFSPYENDGLPAQAGKKQIRKMPTNPEMLELYEELISEGKETEDKNIRQLLKRLKVRSNSGVAVISLLTKPYACPGKCIYCPTERNMPKSYLSKEPAAARALSNDFDPYKQVWSRLCALEMNGHPTDKIEMIMIGGTWDFYPREYQEEFIKEAFRACNNWGRDEENYLKEGDLPALHAQAWQAGKTLEELHNINENSNCRIIGLSVETRPDYLSFKELDWLRTLGITKIEIGVQHLNQHVLDFNKRDMVVKSMEEASEILRDAGFKFVYHMMPNLPESNEEMDVQMFKDLYNGKYHHPDMIKIYPCVILENTELYEMWKKGEANNYRPYDDETLAKVLSQCEKEIKNYTRIIRMIRDIPADYITASSKKSNLREVVDEMHRKEGYIKQDIRAREIRDEEIEKKDFTLTDTIYETENGEEHFLQFENKERNQLAAFCRLRLPKGSSDKELVELSNLKVLVGSALIRELHTYGTLKRVGEEGSQGQHIGFGSELLIEAEKIAKEKGYKKLAIIAGVGVRAYYKNRGYHLEGTYMVKEL